MKRFLIVLALACFTALPLPARAAEAFPPAPLAEVDCATAKRYLEEGRPSLNVLAVSGAGFDSVALGLYGKNGEHSPLWRSDAATPLPFKLEKVRFKDLYLHYTYLPGDKYVSSNIKIAAKANGRPSEALKFFLVEADTELAGFPLLAGDIIVASDATGQGRLSHKGGSGSNDLLLLLRPDSSSSLPGPGLVLALGGGGLASLTWWRLRQPKSGSLQI